MKQASCQGDKDFLALLDYVVRVHEIEICPSSIYRPSMSQLFLDLNAWISFKF